MKTKTNRLTKIALMSALLCVVSPFAITFPFSPVPISLATLILYLCVYILDKQDAVISCAIYLLIGLVGIPVFSGFTGGLGKVLGPTGGYLIGYLFLVYISGWFMEKCSQGSKSGNLKKEETGFRCCLNYLLQGIGMILGTVVCYFFGSLWLSYQSGMEFAVALSVGVLPFIFGDIVKLVAGVIIGNAMRKRLVRAGFLTIGS